MAALHASTLGSRSLTSSLGKRSTVSFPRAKKSVRVCASADRPVWYPGTPPPAHLDGTLAGDFGFDPLKLGADPQFLRWFVQAELVHCRWAMLGVAGILFTGLGAKFGMGFPQWYDAPSASYNIGYGTLVISSHLLVGWAEMKRLYDWKNPGSQGDGSFLGVTEPFKGKENGYPGGIFFDPLGYANNAEAYKTNKWKEIRNGRLAMVAIVGFLAQHAATGKGPIDNLFDHLADPYNVTFATNGVSLPFLH